MTARNMDLAVEQLVATIRAQLIELPPGDPVQGLTGAHVENLARTIAACLDEYGCSEPPSRES